MDTDINTEKNTPPSGGGDGGAASEGQLLVRVFTARGGIPVKDALVTVLPHDKSLPSPQAVLLTDESGKTRTVSLPAPPRSLSLSPADTSVFPAELPYSLYTVKIEREGFYTLTNINVRIFSGITAIQDADLVPRAEELPRAYYLDDGTYVEGEEGTDL